MCDLRLFTTETFGRCMDLSLRAGRSISENHLVNAVDIDRVGLSTDRWSLGGIGFTTCTPGRKRTGGQIRPLANCIRGVSDVKGFNMNSCTRRSFINRSSKAICAAVIAGLASSRLSRSSYAFAQDSELSDSAKISQFKYKYNPGDPLCQEDIDLLARRGITFDEYAIEPHSIINPFNDTFHATRISPTGIHTEMWGNVYLENKDNSQVEYGGTINAGSLEAGFRLITVTLQLQLTGLAVGPGGGLTPVYVGSQSKDSSMLNVTDWFTGNFRERASVVIGATPIITVYADLEPTSSGVSYRVYDDDHDFASWL